MEHEDDGTTTNFTHARQALVETEYRIQNTEYRIDDFGPTRTDRTSPPKRLVSKKETATDNGEIPVYPGSLV